VGQGAAPAGAAGEGAGAVAVARPAAGELGAAVIVMVCAGVPGVPAAPAVAEAPVVPEWPQAVTRATAPASARPPLARRTDCVAEIITVSFARAIQGRRAD
jgi:hypothetical protein